MGKFCPDVKLAYGIRGNRSKSLFTPTLSLNGMTGKRPEVDGNDKLAVVIWVHESLLQWTEAYHCRSKL